MKFKVGDIVMNNPEYFGFTNGGKISQRKGVVTKIEDGIVYVSFFAYKKDAEYSHSSLSLLKCTNPNDILKKLL